MARNGVLEEARTSRLARDGLREYAAHPLLTTVGIDRSYYAPIPDEDLRRYAEQVPAGFRACLKAPSSVTSAATFDPGARTRSIPNPDLHVGRRGSSTSSSSRVPASFAPTPGPFVLEFPPAPGTRPIARWVPRTARRAARGPAARVRLRGRDPGAVAAHPGIPTRARAARRGARLQLLVVHAHAGRPGCHRVRPRTRHSSSSACCSSPARATRTSARRSARSTASSSATIGCACRSRRSWAARRRTDGAPTCS